MPTTQPQHPPRPRQICQTYHRPPTTHPHRPISRHRLLHALSRHRLPHELSRHRLLPTRPRPPAQSPHHCHNAHAQSVQSRLSQVLGKSSSPARLPLRATRYMRQIRAPSKQHKLNSLLLLQLQLGRWIGVIRHILRYHTLSPITGVQLAQNTPTHFRLPHCRTPSTTGLSRPQIRTCTMEAVCICQREASKSRWVVQWPSSMSGRICSRPVRYMFLFSRL